MKRSTLLILLVAAIAGVAVYFLEIKDAKPRDETPDTTRPAFTFKREDITTVTIKRAAGSLTLESQEGTWMLKEPVSAPVSESAVDALVNDIASAKVERTIPASGEEIRSFGLAEPAVTVEIRLKDGKQHKIRLGTKDFSNLSVYAFLDDAKEVSLLPATVLTSTDKSANDLRDLSILGGLSQYDVSNLSVKNSTGTFTLAKSGGDWTLKAPNEVPADETEVSSLISEITTAKASEIASETSGDLAPFGLDQPAISVTAQLAAGGERQILIGTKKSGDETSHFAKSSDRAPIFKVEAALFEKLNAKPSALRSKQILKLNADELSKVYIRNPNMTLVAEKSADGKWLIKEPADQKDKEALTSKFVDPFDSTKASEVIDKPGAAIASKLTKPMVEVRFTKKDGKTTIVKVSAADGDDVYVRVDGSPTIYKVGKQLLDTLSFKASEVTM
jgi:hypothetical protein